MPSVVGVHGIAQQFKGPNVLRTEWLPPLRDGLWLAGVNFPQDDDLMCAFYGDLFRQPGTKTVGIPHYDTNDVTDDWKRNSWMPGGAKRRRWKREYPVPRQRRKPSARLASFSEP